MVKTLFLILLTSLAWSLEGIVMTFQAPLFRKADEASKVIQRLKQGDKISIHGLHDIDIDQENSVYKAADLYQTGELNEVNEFLKKIENQSRFYVTVDRNGIRSFILKEHIKLVFEDQREFSQLPQDYRPDLTDYRIEEPLPKTYPFIPESGYKVNATLGFGPGINDEYNYNTTQLKQSQSPVFNFAINGYKQSDIIDTEYKRLYVGGTFQFVFARNNTFFITGEEGAERFIQVGFGPSLSYDVFIGSSSRVNLTGSLVLNVFDNYEVTIDGGRVAYKAFSLSPRIQLTYEIKDIVDKLDLIIGPSLHFNLAQSLEGVESNADSTSFGNTSVYNRQFNTQVMLTVGLQNSF